MTELVFCLRRREGLSREEFQRYWLEQHGPLVRRHAEMLGVERYVQVHTISSPVNDALRLGREGPPPYDGVARLTFPSVDAIAEAARTPGGREAAEALLSDEGRFIDLERSPLWVAENRVVVD